MRWPLESQKKKKRPGGFGSLFVRWPEQCPLQPDSSKVDANTFVMYAWGVSSAGQTALGTTGDQTRPAKVPVEVPKFVSLAAGPHAALGLTSEGEIYSWGTGLSGELGLAYIPKQDRPAKIEKVSCKFKAISVGQEHALAISESGDLYVWGANDCGQLGTGDLKPVDRPTKIAIAQKFSQVAAGAKHSLALTDHGLIFVWGGNWAGQLGNSSTEAVLTPTLLSEDINCKHIHASENLSLALTSTFSRDSHPSH